MIKTFIDKKLAGKLKAADYVKQSLLASGFLLVYLITWHQFIPIFNQILFSAVASSTFLTFLSTNIYQNLSSKIFGGQVIGVLVGVVLWQSQATTFEMLPNFKEEVFMVFLAISVGLSLFIMALLNFEHPPAAGTAMAFVFQTNQPQISECLFVIIAAFLLGVSHFFLNKYHLLKDLN